MCWKALPPKVILRFGSEMGLRSINGLLRLLRETAPVNLLAMWAAGAGAVEHHDHATVVVRRAFRRTRHHSRLVSFFFKPVIAAMLAILILGALPSVLQLVAIAVVTSSVFVE